MLGEAIQVGLGLLGAGGQIATNNANRDMAREQMQFQREMSNTSAQRSVADYKAAGLNPALAYERGASSPGGASAVIGNVAEKGISSAMDARMAAANIKTAEANAKAAEANAAKAQADAERTRKLQPEELNQLISNARLAEITKNAAQLRFNAGYDLEEQRGRIASLGANTEKAATEALLAKLLIPGARASADLDEKLGVYGPLIKFILGNAKSATSIIQGIK